MSTAVVSGFLDINNLGAPFDDLALKVWAGDTLAAYLKETKTDGRHIQRKISSGKSAQFPAFGVATTSFHTRGTEVDFQQINSNEIVISIQELLMSNVFLDILDEAKAHYEIRREYARLQGSALALDADLRVFMSKVVASRTSTHHVTGLQGGQRGTDAAMATDPNALITGIYDAAETFDENNVPATERYLFVAPAQYYLLIQDGEFIDKDFVDAGNGDRSKAVLRNAADFEVIKTNNLPSGNQSANTNLPVSLRQDYSAHVAICSHKSAAGSVTLLDLSMEQAWDTRRQGWMMLAKYAKGFGHLRPEAAYELATS